MVWYELPEGDHTPKTSSAGTPYLSWPVRDLKEIDRHTLSTTKLTLVRVDVPHAIIVKKHERWCISARPEGPDDFLDWNKTVNYFRSNNLLI
jgi:hypothetical protein